MEDALQIGISRLLQLVYRYTGKLMPFQVFAYLTVGAANTALNIVLFVIFFQWVLPMEGLTIAKVHVAAYTLALLLAFVVTVPTGFWLNKHVAFATSGEMARKSAGQLAKYFLVVSQGLVSDYLLLKALVEWGEVSPSTAKIVSTVIVLTLNYLLQKFFTFRSVRVSSGA